MSASATDEHVEPVETRVPLEELIAKLSEPGALVDGEQAEVVQTHISVVFLAGNRAWKVKKPIRLWSLLDYGTVVARKHWCEEEVRLNRRLAPDLYRGVVPITREGDALAIGGSGEVVEHAVEMRRIPEGLTLRDQLEAETLTQDAVENVARRLAAFGEAHRIEGEAAKNGLPSRFGQVMRRNFTGSSGGVPDPFPASVHDGLRGRIVRRLAQSRERIRKRVRDGLMVDGHGDIRLEHVLATDGRIEIIDCCEFTERLRHVDPLSDAAFLAMELALFDRADLAHAFERTYLDAAGDPDGAALLPLYRAYRAHVRAMVNEVTCREPELSDAARTEKGLAARRCLALAWTFARAGSPPPLLVMRGAAGTGKSWLASRIAPWLGAEVVRSDVVRKGLLGLAVTDRPDADERKVVYGPEMHARTYAAILERGRESLLRGRPTILDATYVRRSSRDDARALADELGSPFAVVDAHADEVVIRRRLEARAAKGTDASDADWAIYAAQARAMDPIGDEEEAYIARADTEAPPEMCVLPLLAVLEAQVDARREPLGPDPAYGRDA